VISTITSACSGIIGIFALSWLGSAVFYRFMRYDDLEVTVGGSLNGYREGWAGPTARPLLAI
jgi:hypothetical protein